MKKQVRKRRLTSQLDALVQQLSEEFRSIDNPQLMTFRVPTLLEYLMVFLLAKRLQVEEHDLPNLDFGDLAHLSLAGETYTDLRACVLKLGEVRNHLAHDLSHERWLRKVDEFVVLMRLPKAPTAETRLLLYQLALANIYLDVFMKIHGVIGGGDLGSAAAAFKTFRDRQQAVLGTIFRKEG